MKVLFLLPPLVLLAACSGGKVRPEEMAPPPVIADGSIYRADNNIVLFEDRKARQVGDILTILLVEKTDASKSANTSTSKGTSIGINPPTIAGRPVTVGGTEVLNFDVGTEQSFEGSGDSNQSNALSGSLSAMVTRVMPNGNLVISGQKQIALNQGSETVSVEGIVRPADIQPGNTVTSDRIANAKIKYGGKGVVDGANSMGLVARFFNAFFPF
ncbi:flagellar basal body L-ring protein FlgH [Sinimarinibacterium sp. CAU 1509]|uniref:flagellar basal body L-ring protein FlgH n=1 Tax=Sinimarinibacterium sp. CAU 1509 TaxID=2562283 RepID=UPI00200B07F0|nr:flagellar basal body L-ring protein FlgH [Sinimarinibacterium sp. CAU 1509]